MGGARSDGGHLGAAFKVVAIVLATAAVAALAACGWFAYSLNRASSPPDAAEVARSAAVARAARPAGVAVDSAVTDAVNLAPWLIPVTAGLKDTCGSSAGFGVFAPYAPVTCVRSAMRILAVDGAADDRATEWDTALRGHPPRSDEEPFATAQPLDRHYEKSGGVGLDVIWVDPAMVALKAAALAGAPSFDVESVRAETPIDEAAVEAARARYPLFALVVADLTYFDAGATPSPTPHRPGGCNRTDSENCPGG
ncbi:hypothetical protein Val02_48770 [Virgisporangium aliadipatigenens]|uniref:Uncharacterized protein n=1 Tax=Virgisporangium aliadipatigenens TaxID=741659 RepID=A0A8J3YQE9_9ACTN|nr:hypothetical protein [Virgisporangium aliadipatigenens]GIJ47991.1 hypothetical protein Val02_48770 [Virgisporangium aliadipatigenens]